MYIEIKNLASLCVYPGLKSKTDICKARKKTSGSLYCKISLGDTQYKGEISDIDSLI
jgi:hypothetical protein